MCAVKLTSDIHATGQRTLKLAGHVVFEKLQRFPRICRVAEIAMHFLPFFCCSL